jgi:alginate O-acetyltransferase complex protein AlgI
MTFTEPAFWILAAVVYALWLVCRRRYAATVLVLLTGSLVFYGFHQWRLLYLLLGYCLVDWAAALWIERSRRPRLVLTLAVTFNLTVLAYWKYTPMLMRTLARLVLAADWSIVPAPPADWIIPFGISFYSFTGIAYLVDVYRRTTAAEPNLLRYTLSAAFFPHLVAGPILRPDDFLNQLRRRTMPVRSEAPLEALQLLARGFFKKMVLADRIALAIDPFFAHIGDPTTAGVWALPYVWLYALQIFFDFSGYTDIARGLGLLFGFRWPENFDRPYLARSVQEFWQRWHMTLSLFLRDYLYIPLGGSRRGPVRTGINLMLTMLLGGLWHGASWSFMLWGGLHGIYLVIHRFWTSFGLRRRLPTSGLAAWVWQALAVGLTFHCVCLAWCFFRLSALADSLACVRQWLVFDADKILVGGARDLSLWLLIGVYTLAGTIAQSGRVSALGERLRSQPALTPLVRGFACGTGVMLLVIALLLAPTGERPPFIYFQF